MRPGQIRPNELELAILEQLAKKEASIRGSIEQLRVLSREFTGVGCFTTFARESPSLEFSDQQVTLDVLIEMPCVPDGMGATLFLNHGQPHCLELYTFGDDRWDGVYEGFALVGRSQADK